MLNSFACSLIQVLLYVECARRLVNGDTEPPWITLAVLCHLTLSARRNEHFSELFASALSPFQGESRYERAYKIVSQFRTHYCTDPSNENYSGVDCTKATTRKSNDQWAIRLHKWAIQTLKNRRVILPLVPESL